MRAAADMLRTERADPKDDSAIQQAIAAACATMGISPQDYVAIVQSDATLSELEQQALGEAVTGSTDPGPHAAISRESNSGKPGDLSKARSFPVPSRR